MTTCKAAKTYIRKVRRHLICSKGNRARIMKTVQEAVTAYLEDEPEATFSGLVQAIGEPKFFAEMMLEGVPETEVENAQKRKKFHFRTCVIALAVVAISILTALGGFYLKYQDAMRGDFIVDEITIIKSDDMSKEEFMQYMKHFDQDWLGENNET